MSDETVKITISGQINAADDERIAREAIAAIKEAAECDGLRVYEWPEEARLYELEDALDHIRRTCRNSRSQSRRDRWIELRADCALEGRGDDWKASPDTPKRDRSQAYIDELREILVGAGEAIARAYAGKMTPGDYCETINRVTDATAERKL